MKIKKHLVFYIVLLILMMLDVYSIFNTGNPNSLIRHIVRDPGWDFLITGIISLLIVITVMVMNSSNRKVSDPVYLALLENKNYIEKLRAKGKSEHDIALSFSTKLNTGTFGKKLAYKRALKYLKRI